MDEPKAELTPAQRVEALWKVVGRYDTYIGSTNTKAAFLIAFNTFVVGGIVLKWQDIRSAVGDTSPPAFPLAAVLLLAAMGAALASLYLTFQAINPFLTSPKRPNEYHSNLYFGDVSEHADPDKYLQAVGRWDEAGLQKDLAFQAHTLAGGLTAKFAAIRKAIWAVVYVQLPALALTGVVVLWVVTAGVLHGVGK
jgi:hypothetical protein